MNFLINHWQTIVLIGFLFFMCGVHIADFLYLPSKEQKKKLKEWLLFAVMDAEKKYGGKTGELKLRYVYAQFLKTFPKISKIVTFDSFSKLVNEALVRAEHILSNSKEIQKIVKEQ